MNKTTKRPILVVILSTVLPRMNANPTQVAKLARIETKTDSIPRKTLDCVLPSRLGYRRSEKRNLIKWILESCWMANSPQNRKEDPNKND
jgi:hypothetical protein